MKLALPFCIICLSVCLSTSVRVCLFVFMHLYGLACGNSMYICVHACMNVCAQGYPHLGKWLNVYIKWIYDDEVFNANVCILTFNMYTSISKCHSHRYSVYITCRPTYCRKTMSSTFVHL